MREILRERGTERIRGSQKKRERERGRHGETEMEERRKMERDK